ncbi:MAG: hypothetical protein CSA24_00980 [Deltaproteobacteria bacterium]|nr:MAG: hypothetical protein CSA24_00980 [Deltaproteobacteria bacterium]
MRRLLVVALVLAGLALAFFGALAGAEPEVIFFAQTSLALFLVIVAVVLVTTAITSVFILGFSLVGDRLARRRIHRFIGWKLLRSQRKVRTVGSVLRAWGHELRARALRAKVAFVATGLLFFAAAWVLTHPEPWNAIASAVSPSFATALQVVLVGLGGAVFLIGLAGLLGGAAGRPPIPSIRQRSAVTLPTFISIVGVAIGIWALIVVLAVMHGLQSDLRDKILRTNAHLVIEPEEPHGDLGDGLALEQAVRGLASVAEAYAFVHGEVMVSSPAGIAVNVVIKGMSEDALAQSDQLRGHIVDGGVEWIRRPEGLIPDRYRYPIGVRPEDLEEALSPQGEPNDDDVSVRSHSQLQRRVALLPGVLIGAELARNLGVDVGMEIQLISPDGDVGPTGLRPKLRSFRVAGIFKTGMYEYDQKLAYLAIDDAQRFFNYGSDLNRLEARLIKAEDTTAVMAAVDALIATDHPGLVASDWQERNKNLFSALMLERTVMFIILGFIIFVASLLILSSLVMLVVEKVKEIAVLKAVGASDRTVVRAFLVIGAFIGSFGVLAGVPLGVGTGLVIVAQGLTVPSQFYIAELPVKLDAFEVVIIGLAALGMCLFATLYPSIQASRLKPSDGLRHG